MANRSLKLNEFITEYPLEGNWEVSYTDGTHLKKDDYVKLGDVVVDTSDSSAEEYPILPFTFQPAGGKEIEARFSKLPQGQKQGKRASRIIREQLADSVVRTGLLRPDFCLMDERNIEMEFREVMSGLSKHGYLILVVDTSALRRGAISFLHKILSDVLIWTVVPVFVMTEVQHQVKELNDIWRKDEGAQPHPGKCDVLEKRPQVSCLSRELTYIHQWRPVEMLTTLSEHLGQLDDRSRVDRLIIESVKNLKRDRGIHQGVYLLTGDKDMASLANLENVNSLHIGVPPLPDEISSVRYDSHNGRILLSPVHYLLWDLAQVFSTVQICSQEQGRKYELVYYSEARSGFFAHDVMELRGS